MRIKISPSLLACDMSDLAKETLAMEKAGADMVHLDVMDGHFVPNITFGAPVIKALRKKTSLCFDTHLMIDRPDIYAKDFIEAGSDIITFHLEAPCDIKSTVNYIKSKNVKAGLAIKPGTDWDALIPYMADLDMALIMSVEPGFGGQKFMESSLDKAKSLKGYINANNLRVDIQIDGGINEATGAMAADAGVNVFVAGSSLFGAADYKSAVSSLRKALTEAVK